MMNICFICVLCIIHVITGYTVILKTADGQREACVSNEPQYVVPIFDLMTFKGTSRSNELRKWTDIWQIYGAEVSKGSYLWQLDNFAKWNALPQFVSNGIRGYQNVYDVENHNSEDYLHLMVLSSSMTILLTSQKNWAGKNGFIIELDKLLLDGTFQSSVRSCINLETINENCTIISSKNVQLLSEGKQWIFLLMKFKLNGCKSSVTIEGGDFSLSFNHADFKQCGEFRNENWLQVNVAIKSSQPGIFKIHQHPYLLPMNNKEPIKLKAKIRYSGDRIFCLKVRFERSKPTSGIFLVKDATSRETIFNKTLHERELDWVVRIQAPLDAGTNDIELSIATDGKISDISFCKSAQSGIQVVEASEGKLIGCQTLIWNETMPSQVIYAPARALKGKNNTQTRDLKDSDVSLVHSRSDDSGFDRVALSCFLLLVSIMTFSLTLIMWLNNIFPESHPTTLKINYTV